MTDRAREMAERWTSEIAGANIFRAIAEDHVVALCRLALAADAYDRDIDLPWGDAAEALDALRKLGILPDDAR